MKFLKEIKVGDKVERILAGSPMTLIVGKVDDKYIYCGTGENAIPFEVKWEDGWKFSIETGLEHDEDVGWNDSHTGSFLLRKVE